MKLKDACMNKLTCILQHNNRMFASYIMLFYVMSHMTTVYYMTDTEIKTNKNTKEYHTQTLRE